MAAYVWMTAPPVGGAANTATVNSHTYACPAPGVMLAIPVADVASLSNLGWENSNSGSASGTTAQRPTGVQNGTTYFDTTLAAIITWDGGSPPYGGGVWRNGSGAIV